MSALDKHVTVNITKQTATVSRTGFGTPAVLAYHTVFPQRSRLYGSLDEMITDGFTTGEVAYKLAASVFAQNPRPATIVMGRRGTPHIRDVTITPRVVALANTDYTVTINGTDFTFTTDATPTVSEITAGWTSLINAGSENVLATDNTSYITVEAAASPGGASTAGPAFTVEYDRNLMGLLDETVDINIATELANLRADNDDWYGLVADAWGEDEIVALSAAIESAGPKIYIAGSQDEIVIGPGAADVATALQTTAPDRTAVIFNDSLDPMPDAAWLSKQLTTVPGSTTWKFKTLATVAASEIGTAGVANADGKNANTYTNVGGVNMTAEGVMSSGEFIDITRFIDWLQARIRENVFAALARNPKIPYTDAGIQAIVAEVEGVLRQGVANGGINPDEDFTVTAPRASEVDAVDRGARLLPDIKFLCTLAGAIHKVTIAGTVTV